MPRGAEKLTISNMNMGSMGTSMIKGIMKKKNVSPLPEMIRCIGQQSSGASLPDVNGSDGYTERRIDRR
jgi:hypothetical protein